MVAGDDESFGMELDPGVPETAVASHRRTLCSASATYGLFLAFGVGSWITVNALFTELPLLVVQLPEGWRLASDLALAVQLANVGPLAFYWLRRRALAKGGPGADARLASRATYAVCLLGAASMAALAKLWSVTVDIGGKRRSVPLLVLAVTAAMADCTSSLLFWRFAGTFRSIHVSALAAGEGMSGVIASGLAWVQAASSDRPNFSPGTYFALLAGVMCVCAGAFHVLRRADFVAAERRDAHNTPPNKGSQPLRPLAMNTVSAEALSLLLLQGWLNVLQNGVSVSCLALAAKPYGRGTYQAAQTVSLLIDPLAAALGFRLHAAPCMLVPITVALTATYGYILALSLASVTAPLLGPNGDAGTGGTVLVIIVAVGRALTSYAKMRANVLLQAGAGEDAESTLMWSGVAMQSGACIGSVTMFVLINHTALFRSA